MNFLEKNLESIIFKEFEYCQSRGLDLKPHQSFTYRQLNLAPFGIPDLIQVGRGHEEDTLKIRIIECKRNIIDATTYGQAARYQVALSRIFGCCCSGMEFEKVLIGQRVSDKNDFWGIVAADSNCTVYTYAYQADGIRFKRQYNNSRFGLAEASQIFRPSVDRLFRDAAAILPLLIEE